MLFYLFFMCSTMLAATTTSCHSASTVTTADSCNQEAKEPPPSCSICLYPLTDNIFALHEKTNRRNPLGHSFHEPCITTWFKGRSIKEQTCPICRKTDLPIENDNEEDDNDSDDEFEAPNLNLFFETVKGGNVSSLESVMATNHTINLDAKNSCGRTALIIACLHNRLAVAQYLLGKNANPDICSTIKGSSPLMIVAATGHLRLTKALLAANANPMVRNAAGRNAMMIASRKGHCLVIKALYNHQQQLLNQVDYQGHSSLYIAAKAGQRDAVKLLLQLGADANRANIFMDTPLIAAARENHPQIVRQLVKANANPDWENDDGETALSVAKKYGHDEVVASLKKASQ